ncbi:MAG TPA: L-threonylcarbamoyladenylate synthase [Bryobacteraceae bacterium]|nr:L-threonylcarbamoyladenylate synthase [Bryobacteraceae bacterium]
MAKMTCPSNTKVDHEIIRRAAQLIREGGLVAFPTETVYGLGANALDASAVERIFRVKGRPATSPLIVHVESLEAAGRCVTAWPKEAGKLAMEFWPGPLTLVLPKRECIPGIVTAGLPTVGVRVPANDAALALLSEAGVPIAAPSANRFTELSPTTAGHVRKSLGADVDLIVDGGPTQVGIESTVISLAGPKPRLLRPGMISATQVESVIGEIELGGPPRDGAHPSPGLHQKHYSPRTPLFLEVPSGGRGSYLWLTRPHAGAGNIRMPADPERYAAILYEVLHRLDGESLDWIAVELPPGDAAWAGINDRLKRAANHPV